MVHIRVQVWYGSDNGGGGDGNPHLGDPGYVPEL